MPVAPPTRTEAEEDAAFWAPFLAPGEHLLWTGRPPVRGRERPSVVRQRWRRWAAPTLALLVAGAGLTALAWVIGDWRHAGDYGTLPRMMGQAATGAAALLTMGAVFMAGTALHQRWTLARTRQAITSRQVLVGQAGHRPRVESLAVAGAGVVASTQGLVRRITVGPANQGLVLETPLGKDLPALHLLTAAAFGPAADGSAPASADWSGRPVPGAARDDVDGDAIGGVYFILFGLIWALTPLSTGMVGEVTSDLRSWQYGLAMAGVLAWALGIGAGVVILGICVGILPAIRRIRRRGRTSFRLRNGHAEIACAGEPTQAYPITADTKLAFRRGTPGIIHFAETVDTDVESPTVTPIGFDHLAPADADAAWQALLALRAAARAAEAAA